MDLVVDNGKVVEPSSVKKAVATVTRDTQAVVALSATHVREILARKLWAESPWLEKYKSCTIEFSNDGAILTFSTKPVNPTE